MKTVFPNAQLAHVWASQSQEQGRGSSFYFNGRVIYSYRDSWPLAVITPFRDADGRTVVVRNMESVSNTTARHNRLVDDALCGLPFHVIECPSQFSGYTARTLADGNAEPLAGLAKDCADAMRKAWETALRKRCEYRAMHALESAREHWQNALALVALIPEKTERNKARKAIGELPAEFPAATRDPSTYQPPADLIAMLASARRDQDTREAGEKMRAKITDARSGWKDARNPANSASTRIQRAKFAIDALRAAAKFAKRAGATLPRGLPSIASVERYVASLEPNETRERIEWNHTRMLESARSAFDNYYSAMHSLRAGHYATPGMLRRALGDIAGRYSLAKIVKECARVTNSYGNNPDAFMPAARTHKNKAVRDAFAALERDCIAIQARAIPLANRCERMANRESIEGAQNIANIRVRKNCSNDAPDVATLQAEIAAIDNAEKMRADNPSLARGIHRAYTVPEYVADVKMRHARAVYGSRVAAMMTATENAERSANIAAAGTSANAYTAIQASERATQGIQTAESIAALLPELRRAGRMQESADDVIARDFLSRVAGIVRAAAAHVATLETDAVNAWRNRDQAAPRPISTRFRLTANGDEIESSRGARVSVHAGERLWKLIRATVESGQARTWGYGAGPAVGSFRIRELRPDGSATVGCHEISASESRDFAQFMRWPPFDN